jgi:hypothetical protein
MSFTLNSNIEIGSFKRVKPHSVKIKHSISTYLNTCMIKLPTSAVLKTESNEFVTVQTATQINEGDKVTVQLGYNGSLKNEFVGFVARVNFTSPCEVECEGYSYQLRKRTVAAKTFKKTVLKDILKHIITGTDVVLDKDIPSIVLDKIVINGHNGVEVLDMIKKAFGNVVFMNFDDNVLYVGLQFLNPKQTVKYVLGYNVIKGDNLKLRDANNDKVTVVYKGKKKDGSNVQAVIKSKGQSKVITTTGSAGTEGETKTIVTHAITDEKTLKAMAAAKLKKLSYTGYEGKTTNFLQPYCRHGYTCDLKDNRFPERSGKYIVTSLEVDYGMSGARRIIELGEKI